MSFAFGFRKIFCLACPRLGSSQRTISEQNIQKLPKSAPFPRTLDTKIDSFLKNNHQIGAASGAINYHKLPSMDIMVLVWLQKSSKRLILLKLLYTSWSKNKVLKHKQNKGKFAFINNRFQAQLTPITNHVATFDYTTECLTMKHFPALYNTLFIDRIIVCSCTMYS